VAKISDDLTPEQRAAQAAAEKFVALHPGASGAWVRGPVPDPKTWEPSVPPPALQTVQTDPFMVSGGIDPNDPLGAWSHLVNPALGNVEGNYNPLGPNGQALPWGATNWTPRGQAYYGPGLSGWVGGIISRIFAPVHEPITTTSPEIAERIEAATPQQVGGRRQGGRSGVAGTMTTGGIGDTLSAIGAYVEVATDRAGNVAPDVQGPLGITLIPARAAGRLSSEFIRGLMSILSQPSEITEQAAGLLIGAEEIASTSPLPSSQEMSLATRAITSSVRPSARSSPNTFSTGPRRWLLLGSAGCAEFTSALSAGRRGRSVFQRRK